MKTVFIHEDFSNGSFRYASDAQGAVLPDNHELYGYSWSGEGFLRSFAKSKGYEIG